MASLPPMTGRVSLPLWNVDSSEFGSSLVKLDEVIIPLPDPFLLCVGLPDPEEGVPEVETLFISSESIVIANSTDARPTKHYKDFVLNLE